MAINENYKVMLHRTECVVGSLTVILLQIYCWVSPSFESILQIG